MKNIVVMLFVITIWNKHIVQQTFCYAISVNITVQQTLPNILVTFVVTTISKIQSTRYNIATHANCIH